MGKALEQSISVWTSLWGIFSGVDPNLGNNSPYPNLGKNKQIDLNKNGYKGKGFRNNVVWTPKLANMTALVNPDNLLGLNPI